MAPLCSSQKLKMRRHWLALLELRTKTADRRIWQLGWWLGCWEPNSHISRSRGRLNWRKLFSEKDLRPTLTLLVLALVRDEKALTQARVMTNFDQNQICSFIRIWFSWSSGRKNKISVKQASWCLILYEKGYFEPGISK